MTGNPINRGSSQARLTMKLINAWLENDLAQLNSLLDQLGSNYGIVFRNLIVVLGGTIRALADHANQTFDDVLPGLLAQFANRTDSMDSADIARQALTAWSTGDDELIESLDFNAQIECSGSDLVLLHLLGMLGDVSRSWAKQGGFSMEVIRDGWCEALGTPD